MYSLIVPEGVDLNSPTWKYVLKFAVRMEQKLAKNRHKGNRENWLKDSPSALMDRAREELKELDEALDQWTSDEAIQNECADVANFAMMISDGLDFAPSPKPK